MLRERVYWVKVRASGAISSTGTTRRGVCGKIVMLNPERRNHLPSTTIVASPWRIKKIQGRLFHISGLGSREPVPRSVVVVESILTVHRRTRRATRLVQKIAERITSYHTS